MNIEPKEEQDAIAPASQATEVAATEAPAEQATETQEAVESKEEGGTQG
jgi:hypothetical protein